MDVVQHQIEKQRSYQISPLLKAAQSKYKAVGLCCLSDTIYAQLLEELQKNLPKLGNATLFPSRQPAFPSEWEGLSLDGKGENWEQVSRAMRRYEVFPHQMTFWVYTYHSFPFSIDSFPYQSPLFGEFLVTEKDVSFVLTENRKRI